MFPGKNYDFDFIIIGECSPFLSDVNGPSLSSIWGLQALWMYIPQMD